MKYIFNVHSFVDVITNSSTELFVYSGDKSKDVVKEILENLITVNNKAYGKHENFNDMFQNLYIYTEKNFKEDVKNLEDAVEYLWGYEKEENVGKIIIESATDNSIPYWMQGAIENIFGAKRYHIG